MHRQHETAGGDYYNVVGDGVRRGRLELAEIDNSFSISKVRHRGCRIMKQQAS